MLFLILHNSLPQITCSTRLLLGSILFVILLVIFLVVLSILPIINGLVVAESEKHGKVIGKIAQAIPGSAGCREATPLQACPVQSKCTLGAGLDELGTACKDGGFSCLCLLYTSPSPRDRQKSRMPSSA